MRKQRKLHLVCNAHLDPYWQWEWEEGAAAAVSTFRSAADCCELSEGGLVFCHNEVILYKWVEEFEPELFACIQRLVKEGRWHIMGGWYLQPDCNMPCAEAFVRQIRLGRRWFKEKFGVTPTTAINFDSFGHTRGLVQIMAKAGYDSYLHCRPFQNACALPDYTYRWIGYDGSEVLVHRVPDWYNSPLGKAVETIDNRVAQARKDGETLALRLWGVGNHGGGPSRQDTRELDAYIAGKKSAGRKKPDGVTILHSTPEAFFAAVRQSGRKIPEVRKELNACMPGCYTTMIRIKQKNRLLENELWATEKMLAAAAMQGRLAWPSQELEQVMCDLATAQFHDILPGSSIQPVEEAGLRLFDHGLEILSRLKARAFFALAAGQPAPAEGVVPVLIHNPHPWPVEGVWECEFMLADQNWKDGVRTAAEVSLNGRVVASQMEKEMSSLNLDWRKRIAIRATLAPSSMNRFDCKLMEVPAAQVRTLRPVQGAYRFDNGRLRAEVNTLTGWLDRYCVDGVELLRKDSCRLLVIQDNADSWGMNANAFREVEGSFALLPHGEGCRFSGLLPESRLESVRVVEEGPVRVVIESVFGFGKSNAVVTYKLPCQGTQMEVQVRVFWAEKDKMLKLSLPTCFGADPKAEYRRQVPAGEETVPTDGKETVMGQWLLAGNATGAFSVSNDGIHGMDCAGGELRLSLLRSPAYCGHPIHDRPIVPQDRFLTRIDQGERIYAFRLDGEGCAARGKTGARNGNALQTLRARVEAAAIVLNQKPQALSFFPSGGGAPVAAGVTLSDPQVQLYSCARAQEGEGWIVRLFNASAQKRSVKFSLPALSRKQATLQLGAYEIRTLRISADGSVSEASLLD